jgi:succinyldiaminopimelate transaminase
MTEAPAFEPPPYPYHRLDGLKATADAFEGGVVDCSVGTPCDPPPDAVLRALASSGTERGYPESAGSTPYRRAAADWMARRFGVTVELSAVSACVGTKEFVSSTPQLLHLRSPGRDTVLYPAVSYPTYAMGALLSGCRAVPVPPRQADGTGLALERIDPADLERALLLWVNSPSNPTGGLSDLEAVARFGREHDVPVFSDECYCEFTWAGPARSILETGSEGVVAVHSLSKRSNLAGVRAGFFAGDPELVSFLTDLRRHGGLMVPGPVQAAAVAALADDDHVTLQRARYRERLEYLAGLFSSLDWEVTVPDGSFYLWVPVPSRLPDAWAMAAALAESGGMLVSPGDLYGEAGARFVRVATVQPMERLELVGRRLAESVLAE